VHLDTELATELEVVGDPVRLRQVVRISSTNAIRVHAGRRAIHVTLHGEAGEACLQVIDNAQASPRQIYPISSTASIERMRRASAARRHGAGTGESRAAGRTSMPDASPWRAQLGLGSNVHPWLPLAVVS